MADLVTIDRPDSPDRCQGSVPSGQCTFKKEPGIDYCRIHASSSITNNNQKKYTAYMLHLWQQRINQFTDDDQIKSLRSEVAISRLTLETTLNQCKSNTDLMIAAPKIVQLVQTIEKVVKTCHSLEKDTGFLLDKTKVGIVADNIVKVLTRHITDPELLRTISVELLETLLENV